jgi:glycine/D-amino acid oxidase-like deaminating enzyme
MGRPSAEVVIVGGGVMGSAIAYFLRRDPAFDGRIVVVERDPTYKQASSALSASAIRQQFSTPENIAMSRFGFEFMRHIGEHLAVDGETPEIELTEHGYLYLATPEYESVMREINEVQVANDAQVALLSPDELATRYPWMSTDGVALASLGLRGEGWFDGYALMRAFRRKARALGVEYLAEEVVGLSLDGSRVTGVRLGDGSTIDAGVVVDAAGPWAATIAAMARVALPVEARRRCVFVFESQERIADCPLVIDTSGAWFRPEGGAFIGAVPPPEAEDLADLPLEVDRHIWDDELWPAIAARVPAFDTVRLVRAWAGYYEMNVFDHNSILGPHPEVTNLLFANGFSGHGIQQSPAVGRAIAELIVHGRYVSLDLAVFGFERISAGRPVVERNVIG